LGRNEPSCYQGGRGKKHIPGQARQYPAKSLRLRFFLRIKVEKARRLSLLEGIKGKVPRFLPRREGKTPSRGLRGEGDLGGILTKKKMSPLLSFLYGEGKG